MSAIELLVEQLKSIREEVLLGNYPRHGICDAVARRGLCDADLIPYFKLWPKYSGNPSYPVPSDDARRGPDSRYYACGSHIDFWTGDYGMLRRELLDFLIDAITEDERNPYRVTNTSATPIEEEYHA